MGHGQASATSREDSTLRLRQFERVVEGLDEMIVVADLQYRIVLANRSFLEYVGRSADQCMGWLIPEVVGQEVFRKSLAQ